MSKIIECVPNFSEGRDPEIIRQITNQIETVAGAKLLDVDPGKATNRTVVTLAGPPESVIEAAFRAIAAATELIDMSTHSGEHPRFGATDVCPLIPVAGIDMAETVDWARRLAERLGAELGLTIYCYENAALHPDRRNLATVRAGEYEGLERKLASPAWKPDFGPNEFNPQSGATAVGARDFLVAYNVNLNTTSTRRANAVAFDVRERGRVKRDGDPLTGKIVRDEDGSPVSIPGSLKSVKAIGWYIEEYGVAQISMNLTNISVTPVHVAYDEVFRRADARGLRVTGSELVGLIPLQAMLDAGGYFLEKQQRSIGIPDAEIIKIAVKSMGLDELGPFDPREKIIEYVLANSEATRLADSTLKELVYETGSESPAPGGGSVSAAVGALGAALGAMVANLSAHKRGWDDRWEEFSDWAARGKECYTELLRLVDEDTRAFNGIMQAFRLPKRTEEEKGARSEAIQEATRVAIETPLQVMQVALDSMEVLEAMAGKGNPASVSDAGVGALCARTAVRGGFLNVQINSTDLTDRTTAAAYAAQGQEIQDRAEELEARILEIVHSKI